MILRRLRMCATTLLVVAVPTTLSAAAAPAPSAEPRATTIASAQAGAATRPSPRTRHATRILVVQPNSVEQPAPEFYIATTDLVRQRLAAQGVNANDEQLSEWLSFSWNGNVATISLQLPQTAPPIAGEIVDQLVSFTRVALVAQQEESRKQSIARADAQADEAAMVAADASRQLKELRQRLRDLSGRSDVSPKTLTTALSNMDDELQRLQLERLSKESRQKALEEAIAELSARVQKRIESDPIVVELQKVVDAREERVKTMKQMADQGAASREEISQAIAQAAEAKAKVLQQQRDSAAAAGGTALEAFNRELLTLSIDSRELDTRVKYLDARLPRLREAVESLDDYTRTEHRAADANNALDISLREQRNVRDQYREDRTPRVLLKESRNEAE